MGASWLPPRGVFIPTRVLFDRRLPAGPRETLLQLMALAWSSAHHALPPVSYDTLSGLLGKSISTLYSHFAVLRGFHSALRLRGAGNGLFIVTLADWLYAAKFPENRKLPENKQLPDSGNQESGSDQNQLKESDQKR